MITYELKDGIIIKKNCDNQYDPSEYEQALKKQKQLLVELEAGKKVIDAEAYNIKEFHPEVAEMSEELRNHVWMYHERYVKGIQAQSNMDRTQEVIKALEEEMEEITKQTGLEFKKE